MGIQKWLYHFRGWRPDSFSKTEKEPASSHEEPQEWLQNAKTRGAKNDSQKHSQPPKGQFSVQTKIYLKKSKQDSTNFKPQTSGGLNPQVWPRCKQLLWNRRKRHFSKKSILRGKYLCNNSEAAKKDTFTKCRSRCQQSNITRAGVVKETDWFDFREKMKYF